MKFSSACIISITLILSILSINPNPTSAHFFPNTSAIPSYLIKNTTIWDSFINLVDSKKGQKIDGLSKLKKYFHYFGYINNSYSDFSNDFDDSLASAVKTYQLNFNLNATGRLDTSTLEVILQPRCGNPDIVNGTSTMRSGGGDSAAGGSNFTFHTVAHYSFFPGNPRWPARKSQLTYAFLPENQLSDAVKSVFTRAFLRWSEVTPLVFFETSSFDEADVKIGFFSGDHGDGEPFDGVLGTLAHAFSPPAGLFHLDGDENWVLDGGFLNGSPETAVDLESVAVHEIGHILGLGHSSVKEAMMYPTISSGTRKVELANDDVVGIQELYGSNPNYNGSVSHFTPTGQRDTSRASKMDYPLWRVGLLSTLLLFV